MARTDLDDLPSSLPVHELAGRLRERRLTAVALAESCLARIEATADWLHGYVAVHAEEALRAAAARDAELAGGHHRGPLHGIPVALKDLFDVAGQVTTFGSRSRLDAVAERTASAVARLEAAGMVVLGKTHLVEFAFGSWGTNATMGTPWNPCDRRTHRVPGGSSSGSAVAVAARTVPVALGSDTGGSMRIPASACGIVGLKPTVGTLPMDGVQPLSPTFDTIGPMTRSVRDAALVHAALAGLPGGWGEGMRAADLAGFRLGALPLDALEPLAPETREAYRDALSRLARAGCAIREVPLPLSMIEYQQRTGRIMSAEAYSALGAWVEREDLPFDPNVRGRILAGRDIPAEEVAREQAERARMKHQSAELFAQVEALILPATPLPAIPVAEVDESIVPMSRLTRFVNYLDLCALAVPVGRSADGLPLSIQLVAPGRQEGRALALGLAVEGLVGGQGGPN